MSVSERDLLEAREVRVEAFLYDLYNRILRRADSKGLRRVASFAHQSVFPWQQVDGREYSRAEVPLEIEGAVIFSGEDLNLGVVLGRGYNGLVRRGFRPLRLLFGGCKYDMLGEDIYRGKDVNVTTLRTLIHPYSLGGLNGEFYGDEGAGIGINCWVDSQRYGGSNLRVEMRDRPEAFLNEVGQDLCIALVERTIQKAR